MQKEANKALADSVQHMDTGELLTLRQSLMQGAEPCSVQPQLPRMQNRSRENVMQAYSCGGQQKSEAEMQAVKAELRPGADDSDKRLAFYAAARANLQYQRTVAQSTPTYAGGITHDAECSLAERLLRAVSYISCFISKNPAAGRLLPASARRAWAWA